MTKPNLDIVRPVPLAPGSLVRIISPSLPSMAFATARAERAKAALKALGLRVDFSPNCFEVSDDGWSAGTPQMRADDLHGAFADANVAAVLCAAGGATSAELLPHLSASVFADNPKPLIGRSDNIVLNAFLQNRARVSSFFGVAYVFQFGEPVIPQETITSFRRSLMTDDPVIYQVSASRTMGGRDWRLAGHDDLPLQRLRAGHHSWLRPGVGSGPLVGAELNLIPQMVDEGLLDTAGCVLWLDAGKPELSYTYERLERIAKMIDLRAVNGMLISDNPWIDYGEWTTLLDEFIARYLAGTDFPILVGGDCGHYDPAWVLPYGDKVVLDSERGVVYRDEKDADNSNHTYGGTMSHNDSNLMAVTNVFEEVLGKKAGPDDDFFSLGGHSLLVVEAIARLRNTYGLKVPARQFLNHATPAAIAEACAPVERPRAEDRRDEIGASR
ncbi:LD-carboxypeptidase [Micromonospora haikouensis]|uniref:LD-carboxypeptidase n=1 Tax=Micromonospora haikouensis TaxID=686309 RepID=UPI003D761C33